MTATGMRVRARGPKAAKKQVREKYQKADSSQSLDKFWKEFRLSPVSAEHAILTKPLLLSLVAVGPLVLLVLFSFLREVTAEVDSTGNSTFSDLSDSIFVYITLSLLFGALLYSLDWYPHISRTFQSLFINKVICTSEGKPVLEPDYLKFLQSYRHALHSRRRYIMPCLFGLLLVISTVLVTVSRASSEPFKVRGVFDLLHFLTRWVLAPAAWGFVGGLGLWTVYKTARAINDITPYFQVNVQPLHSDRAGGFKKVGDLCSQIGLLVIVIAIPAIFLSVRGTISVVQSYTCGNEMRPYVSGTASSMTEEQFAKCVYYSQGGSLSGLTVRAILEEVQAETAAGKPLASMISEYYLANEIRFQQEYLLRSYDLFFAMDFFIVVILVFAVFIVIAPMWDIHNDMRDFKQRHEREANDRIGSLYFEVTKAIDRDDLEQANQLKAKIKFFTDELAEVQKYPVWPISSLPVIRSYLTSSLLSALFTYFVSALSIPISAQAQDVIKLLINPS